MFPRGLRVLRPLSCGNSCGTCSFHSGTQVFLSAVCVPHRCTDICVAQQLLNRLQVTRCSHEPRGSRVPRVLEAEVNDAGARPFSPPLCLEACDRNGITLPRQASIPWPLGDVGEHCRLVVVPQAPQQVMDFSCHWDCPSAVPLACHGKFQIEEIDLVPCETDELGTAAAS